MFRPRLWAKYAEFMRTDCRLYDEYPRGEHRWCWGAMPPCIHDLDVVWQFNSLFLALPGPMHTRPIFFSS